MENHCLANLTEIITSNKNHQWRLKLMNKRMMRNGKLTLSRGVSAQATITYEEKDNLFGVKGLADTQLNQVVKSPHQQWDRQIDIECSLRKCTKHTHDFCGVSAQSSESESPSKEKAGKPKLRNIIQNNQPGLSKSVQVMTKEDQRTSPEYMTTKRNMCDPKLDLRVEKSHEMLGEFEEGLYIRCQ